MFVLLGYIIHEMIHENNRIRIYRGYAVRGQVPVIIKVLKEEANNPVEISKFIYEYEITRTLEIEGIIKPIRLEKAGNSLALIMEDTGAVYLREYVRNNYVDIPTFLDIAVQLAETLGELHQNGIIHRDLRSENILVHPGTGKTKIIDFSTAVLFSTKIENATITGAPLGTLEHMPLGMPLEQSWRVESDADYRSDYYSLGVVFYEVLTGQPLLQSEDPVECLHVHIAGKPEAPDKINPKIPQALCAVIMKLLSQNPDERYQSAFGLVRDLEECRRQWNLAGKIEPFTPGQMDISPRFELPRRLYGRKDEAQVLKTAFERACANQGEFIMVSGYAGTGKTMLINETLKPIAMKKGYFAYGKFDQLRQNIPYASFAAAMGSVIRQLMTESKENLEIWREKILRALGRSGAVITGLIPEVEMIIGQQPPVEALQPKEAQNRFFMVFGNFIKVFAEKEHPLVIFLDDIQWADLSSLQLIRYLCRDTNLDYLLLAGAYRDNEVTAEHPLPVILEKIREEGIPVRQIHLAPFDRTEVIEFIAGALHCPEAKVELLADTLYRKTCGIPFFLGQLLKSVYNEKLITFNMKKGCWEWEIEAILGLQMPDDVMDLILEKLQTLPGETISILKLASCIGNTFDIKTLSTICEKTQVETASLIFPAVLEGFVPLVSHEEKDLQVSHQGTVTGIYEFLHDMVRQAVYSLFPEEEKKKAHVKVGRMILQSMSQNELDDRILSVLDHLNRGLDLIKDLEERLKLAGYNLTAGRKAKASAAYDLAISFFRAGMELLPDGSWDSCYNLCYDLYMERAQCEYLAGDPTMAERLFDMIVNRLGTELERADVYSLKMVLYTGTGKYGEAVKIGLNALKNLGMKLPSKPGIFDNARELLLYKWHMRNKSIDDLAELPEMEDPVQKKVAQLLISFILVTCTSYPDLYALAIIKAGNHAVRYGNNEIASIGYIGYSIIEGSVLGNYADGYKLGKVAVTLVERFGKNFAKCIVYFTVGSIIYHWTRHGKEGLQYLYKAVQCAIEAGNVLIAGYSYGVILENKYIMGTALDEVLEEARKCSSYARKMKHENLAINAAIYERLASALVGRSGGFAPVGADGFDEDGFIKSMKGDKASMAAYYFSKMQLCYLSGEYRDAISAAEKIKSCTGAIMGFMLSAEYNFYYSLAITAIYEQLSPKDRKRFIKVLKKNQRQMKKWSYFCPENFLHKYLLVEAEISRIFGRKQKAWNLYDKAIRSAHENGYIQNKAIACELAARFYSAEGRDRIAKAYMSDAFRLYCEWGAVAKIQDLECRYPELLDGVEVEEEKGKYDSAEILRNILMFSNISESKAASDRDIYSIQKVIRNISEQSDPDKLLENFLEVAVESAGANKGYLILEKDDELFIEAAIEAAKVNESSRGVVIKSISLEESDNLSRSVVRYVARTFEPVIVNSIEQAGIFARDPYITKSGVKSIACIPLQLRDIPVGVLYLENSFMPGVFTEERLGLLKLLAGQMIYAKALQTFLERDASEIKGETYLSPADFLTEREMEVLRLIGAGLSNREIAERLEVTVNTVKTHIKNIYGKLQVNRRVQVVARAKELNML
ncbi:MAG: AAA family ATPase [Firmicutes bacterium]|nr:AAA family ATPase [Bacillota bacterium]